MNQSSMRSVDRSPTNARGTAPGWARRLAAVLMATAVAAVPAAWSQAQNSIRAITTTTEGGNDVVRVELDKPLTELPKGFSIQSPARIALDFAGVGNSTGRSCEVGRLAPLATSAWRPCWRVNTSKIRLVSLQSDR